MTDRLLPAVDGAGAQSNAGTRPSIAAPPGAGAAAPTKTLFVCSTPLHTFFALGLMQGPYKGGRHAIALINQPPTARDYIVEALQASDRDDLGIARFAMLEGLAASRATLRRIRAFTAELQPATIATGNDRRLEFYAAARGCPAARRTYIDDGLFSYFPRHEAMPAWRESLSGWVRSLKYGLPIEHPSRVGGSRAVQDAFVLMPSHVHRGLAAKPVRPFLPEWFAQPPVRKTCIAAAALAGMDAERCAAIRLLLLLPHPRFMRAHPQLVDALAGVARSHAQRGGLVALKAHPRAEPGSLPAVLGLPERSILEVPARLPVEVLIPLLSEATVVGTLTTALLSLALLGRGLAVRSLMVSGADGLARYDTSAERIFRAAGIEPLSVDE